MNTKIAISVLLTVILASLMTAFGQETADKKKQEADLQKKKEHTAVIVEGKKIQDYELQKAMQEALKVQEKNLVEQKKKGMIDEKTYLHEADALKKYQQKLEELGNLEDRVWMGVNTDPAATKTNDWVIQGIGPDLRYQFRGDPSGSVFNLYPGRENNSLNISKKLEDVTLNTDFNFDVKEDDSSVNFFVNGTMSAGELKITVVRPNGEVLHDFTISPLADVNWNQVQRPDEDGGTSVGKWQIRIRATKASGNYRVQVYSR